MNLLTNTSDFTTSVVILSAVIFYYAYFYFTKSRLPQRICTSITRHAQKEIALFLLKKISGFIILGFVPGVIYYFFLSRNFEKFGISIDVFIKNLPVIFLLGIFIILIVFINQKINMHNNSLKINLSEWNILLYIINALGWILYLIGYEFLFRGILLSECYNSFGFWPAVAINVAIYSAIHMVNGKDETIGAIIFGGIACYFALSRETILIPIMMHILLSVFSDYFSIRYNASVRFIKQTSFNLPQK